MKNKLPLLLVSLLSITVKAQWTKDTLLNTTVRDSVGTEESYPHAVTRSDGSTFVSFFEQYNGNNQLRMQLINKSGYKLWPFDGLIISSFPQQTSLFHYDLKIDKDDNAIIAFQDIRTNDTLNIVTYKIDSLGNFLWGANGIQLIDPVASTEVGPTIGITNSNNVIISWNAERDTAHWVAFEKISSQGTILWNKIHRIIDSTFTVRYSRPVTIASGADDFIMLYAEETGAYFPPISQMYAQRYNGGGSGVWINPVLVSNKYISIYFFPDAYSDLNGGFYTAFEGIDPNSQFVWDAYVQHVDSSGKLWNTTGSIACTIPNSDHFTPAARFDVTTNSFWVLMQVTNTNGINSGVYIQSLDPYGNVLLGSDAAELIAPSAMYYNPYDFSVTSNGVISLYTAGSNTQTRTIGAVKNDFNGALLWGGIPASVCSNISEKSNISAGLFLNNQVVTVWSDKRNDNGIYAQNITNDGPSGIANIDSKLFPFSLYPSPVLQGNNFTISLYADIKNAHLEICNALGKIIYSEELNVKTQIINSKFYSPGIYFIRIRSGEKMFTKKFIIQ